jgi:hypothetical protein
MADTVQFRQKTPQRAVQPTKAKHRDYIDELQQDFNSRCGYCDSFDGRRSNDFEVDHFVPRRVLRSIRDNDYNNLVYACKSCNRSKSGKWPSNDEMVCVVGDCGFVDPADEGYESHFIRYDYGEIYWQTPVGKWMYHELALYNDQHAISWMLEKLRNGIEEGNALLVANPNQSRIKEIVLALYQIEDLYLNKLFNVK